MSLADLINMFSARIIGTYSLEQYAKKVMPGRKNPMMWGMGQW
jgi:hypothetical protein